MSSFATSVFTSSLADLWNSGQPPKSRQKVSSHRHPLEPCEQTTGHSLEETIRLVFTPTSPTSSATRISPWISRSPTLSPTQTVNETVSNSVLSHSSITKATTTRTPSKTSNQTFDFVTYAHHSLSNLDTDQLQNAVDEILPINYRFTNKDSGGEVVLRLKSAHATDNTGRPLVIGALTIPAKTFQDGCLLIVSSTTNTSSDGRGLDDHCRRDDEPLLKPLTATIDIRTNQCCGDVAALRNDLYLQLAGQPENGGCLSFRQGKTAPWTCLHHSRLVRLSVGLGVYESRLTHFTTFAALLAYSPTPCSDDDVYWIVSLCLLSVACVSWLLLAIVYQYNRRFCSWIRNDHAATISKVLKKVEAAFVRGILYAPL
eukprot:TRINITY_DN16352_c0_g1_i2.p1 TRINITY_DN16352_c0_g1~~TRINITY_DN16352_c0_g1_i2.p1  ORF type:complete len:372 (-),score=28.92 TRINITY_DN16352_c0_g1_i2:67-1182(-)